MGSTIICLCKCSPATPLLPPRSLFHSLDQAAKQAYPLEQSQASSDTTAQEYGFHIPAIRVAREKVKHPTEFHPQEKLEVLYTRSKKQDSLLTDVKVAKFLGFHISSKAILVMKPKSPNTDYKLYCLKVFKRETTINFDVIKMLPLNSSSPFLASIKSVYEGDSQVFFLNEYVSGGKLLEVMVKSSLKSELLISFIMGEILLALEYLHSAVGIPCGNLKSNNIHLTSRGHIALTDYGIGKRYNSLMNTEDFLFMAPEVLSGSQPDQLSDFWSFGVLLVVALTGSFPFKNIKDRDVLARDISDGNVAVPDGVGPVAGNLIARLLKKDRDARMGKKGVEEVKKHAFFGQVKWEILRSLKIRSPFVMKGKNVTREGSKESLNSCNNAGEDTIHSVMHFLK